MTYTPAVKDEFHTLVEIELDTETLRYADENLSMSNGYFYDGRLQAQTLTRSFSSFSEPKQRESTLTINLLNKEGTVRDLLNDPTVYFANRLVTLYIGQGTDFDDYHEDFKGYIKFPGGTSFDENGVKLELPSIRNKEWKTIPPNKYLVTDYPNIEIASIGKPIPYVFGEWSFYAVPCVCINTETKQFKIADHEIQHIYQVYKNGANIAHFNEDLVNATFTITVSWVEGTDVISATVLGLVDGGNFLRNPIDILQYIQVSMVGIAAGDIDAASYLVLHNEFEDVPVHFYCDCELSSNEVMEQLAIELNFDIYVTEGTYKVASRAPGTGYSMTFDESNIVMDSFSVDFDPEELYANKLIAQYDYNPLTGLYGQDYTTEETDEQGYVKEVVVRHFEFKFVYGLDDVEVFLQRRKLLFAKEIRVVTFEGMGAAITLSIADRVQICFSGCDLDSPLYIRRVAKNFKRKIVTISGYDILTFMKSGFWMEDTDPDYTTSTEKERQVSGYWLYDDDDVSNPEAVWDDNFVMVQHMNDTTTSTITDSTSNNNDGTKKGANEPIEVAGQVGMAQSFDGGDDYISVSTSSSLKSARGTIEFLVKMEVGIVAKTLIQIMENAYTDYLVIRRAGGGRINIDIEDGNVVKTNMFSTTEIIDNNWHYICITQDGNGISIYIDGTKESTTGTNSNYWTNHLDTLTTWISRSSWVYSNNIFDEVRVSDDARSDAWIKATFNALNGTLHTMEDDDAHGSYRKKITIDNTKIDSALTDFPDVVILDDTNFIFSLALSTGYDIRFTSDDGVTLLDFERVSHNQSSELAEYHAKIPSISSTVDTVYYMYYGTKGVSKWW